MKGPEERLRWAAEILKAVQREDQGMRNYDPAYALEPPLRAEIDRFVDEYAIAERERKGE